MEKERVLPESALERAFDALDLVSRKIGQQVIPNYYRTMGYLRGYQQAFDMELNETLIASFKLTGSREANIDNEELKKHGIKVKYFEITDEDRRPCYTYDIVALLK